MRVVNRISTTFSFILFSILPIISTNKLCTETELIGGEKIVWNRKSGDDYFATPHCIGKNGLPQYRKCENGKFVTVANCTTIQHEINYCPNGFNDTKATTECCKILPKATNDKSKCPYNYLRPLETTGCTFSKSWYPAVRNPEYGIGEFMIREASDYNGIILENIVYVDKYHNSDCIVYDNYKGSYEAVPCNHKYDRLCSYHYLHKALYRPCEQRRALQDNCVSKDFGFESDHYYLCICAKRIDYRRVCPQVELRKSYQSSISLFLESDCLLPLEFNGTDLVWSSTKSPVSYYYWSNLYIDKSTEKLALHKDGWTSYKNSNCKICEEQFPIYDDPEIIIELTFNVIKITVTYFTESMVKTENESTVWCFTDSVPDHQFVLIYVDSSDVDSGDVDSIRVDSSGNYWCEFFHIKDFSIRKSNNILYINENIFVLKVTMSYDDDPTARKFAYGTIKKIEDSFNRNNLVQIKIKWMKTLYLDSRSVTYLWHICTKENKETYLTEYRSIVENINLSNFPEIQNYSDLATDYCFEAQTNTSGKVLTWPITFKGLRAVPTELCFDEFYDLPTRGCGADFFEGAKWVPFMETCLEIPKSEFSSELANLLLNECDNSTVAVLLHVTQNSDRFEYIDIYLSALIIKKMQYEIDLLEVTGIISNLMNSAADVLQKSQEVCNATDLILNLTDSIFMHQQLKYDNVTIYTDNLVSFIYNANINPYHGLALIKKESYIIKEIMDDEEIASIPNLEMAVYLSKEIIEEVKLHQTPIVTINVFMKPNLFNENENQKINIAKNFGILLPLAVLPKPIKLYYKSLISTENSLCSFWNYGFDNKGAWLSEQNPTILQNNIHICSFNHVTHFGLLLMNKKGSYFSKFHTGIYNIISITGSVLSLLGTIGIFITAILFKPWRKNKGNAILIHYNIVSFTQIISLFVSYNVSEDDQDHICLTIGIILHYSTLSQHCWMFVFGVLQYLRYVKVLYNHQKWVLTKACLFCYVLPWLPIIALELSIEEAYVKVPDGLCYPRDEGLIYFVIVPIAVIITANLFILVKIYMEMFYFSQKFLEDDMLKYRIRLMVLLFFMLGITWTFGLTAQVFNNNVLFCLFIGTTSSQSFILFIYFILLNKSVRQMYRNFYNKVILQ